jgi:putative tryptophan/tyrosine transport system substrate-binding protein
MRRREFIVLAGGAGLAYSSSARAQQRSSKSARIGIIDPTTIWDAFREELRNLGYVEGQNITFEYRHAEGQPERLAIAAAELVRVPVDVIATYGTPATGAAKQATTTIPIVAISVGDPVRAGVVASLARPGRNVTGNSLLGPDIAAKQLQLLREAVPPVARVAFLWNPDNASNVAFSEELKTGTRALGMELISVPVRRADELNAALASMMQERPDALLMTNDPLLQRHVRTTIDFVAEHRLPASYQAREHVVAGGLMSYGASSPELFRRGAIYVHRILQGTKPQDLPVEQPSKFELVFNLRTAKALGLVVPEALLARADEVIE